MSDNRGIFSLEEFYNLQVSGETTNVFEVFRYVSSIATPSPLGTDYGYFGGGTYNTGGSSSSIIQRIDFNNDTANSVTKGNETVTAQNRGGTSSTSYGYLGGGNDPAYVSTVDRIDYSNDATTASPKGPLTLARARASGTHNSDYGYQGGGYAPASPNYVSIVDRIDFSNDTATAVAKGPLTSPKQATIAVGNQSYGYFAAGSYTPWPTIYSLVDRLDYSSDTTATAPKGNLTRARAWTGGAGNASYGYIGAGYFDPGPYAGSTMDRIDYSNDTAAAVPAGPYLKSSNSWNLGATGNTSYGYWAGDERNADGSEIGRLDYSNDTQTTTQVASLSGYMQRLCGFSSRANANPTFILPSPVPATRSESGLVAGGNDFGYNAGGRTPGSTDWTNVDRLDFANDTNTMATKGPLSIKRSYAAALTSVSHGYAAGNFASNTGHPSPGPTVEKIDYANDTAVGTITALMASFGYYRSGSSNKSYGWVSGGPAWNGVTTVERLDWSNDSATSSPRGNLNVSRHHPMAVGNMSYGYHYGGQNGPSSPYYLSSVSRIDYSNDSATASPKGPLTDVTTYGATTGAGNADYGYADKIGGYSPGSGYSTLNRIDYSNDTATALPKGTKYTSPNTYLNCTVSNSLYGWWVGGYPSSTIVMRIDFSNDTAAAQPKGNTSVGRGYTTCHSARMHGFNTGYIPGTKTVDRGAEGYLTAGASGPAYGYWIGGGGGGSQYNRVDFSNDTGTAGVRGNLDRSVDRTATVSSMNYSYTVAGWSNTNISRIDYADDTATATPKGNLPPISGLSSPAGVDNNNYGYICGGLPLTTVNRIDFSNDTAVASAKGPLTATRRYISATGNQSYGYVIAGTPPSKSSTDRIDYSNDSVTATVKGNLPYNIEGNGATGNADYGYVTGGFNTAPGNNNWISSTSRIDYSNDTATAAPKGPLTQIRKTKSTGSASYGWSGGGSTNGHAGTSTMDRIDYANDTATASARGSLSGGRTNHYAASGQSNAKAGSPVFIPRIRWVDSASEGTPVTQGPAHGYFAGGAYPSVSAEKSTVDRIDYANDTATASPKGYLASATKRNDAVMNSTHGYVTGNMPAEPSRVQRIDYANDTAVASIKGPLSAGTQYMMDVTNINFGYVIGGGGPAGQRSKIDRIDFSNDTATASNIASLPANRWSGTGIGNKNFGYICGGKTPSIISNIDRLDYSSDTTTVAPKGPLSATRRYNSATSNNDFGYVGGGAGNNSDSSVDRVDFSNDTATASTKGPLTTTGNYRTATGNSNFGYFAGGQGPSMNLYSTIDRIDYSNDTATASPKGALSIAKNKAAGISARESGLPIPQSTIAAPVQPPFPLPVQLPGPGPAYGYFGGGRYPSAGNYSIVDRVDYSNDTPTMSVRGNLSQDTKGHGATGNKEYGYFGGGRSPSVTGLSTVNRVDYSNDSVTAEVKGSLSYADQGIAATGNVSYGYFMGGPSLSTVSRIDFSSDTSTATTKGPLSAAKWYGAATGNQSYGYVGGGIAPGTVSSIDRIDYASDSSTASPKGPLTAQRYATGATGNSSYGYFGGGRSGPSRYTIVDRLDYSNDTATTVAKGPLTSARQYLAATGDASFGYIAGGFTSSSYEISTVDRLDYSNDTATAVAKGPLSQGRAVSAGASARANGLPQ